MKYSKLLCFVASTLLITGCGKGGNGKSKDYSTLLAKALDAVGTNYTVDCVFDNEEEEDALHKIYKFGNGFRETVNHYEVAGYGKVQADKNTYHQFLHHNPNTIESEEDEYFNLYGRRDYSDKMLTNDATLKNYFDLSKFEKVSNTQYRSKDENNITSFLSVVGDITPYEDEYYGHEGIDIVLNRDGSFKTFEWYGIGSENHEQVSNDRWAHCVFTNIGSTTDDIFFEFTSDESNLTLPTPEEVSVISRETRTNIYEGEHVRLYNMVMSENYNGYMSLIYKDDPGTAFIIKDPEPYKTNYFDLVTVEGYISTVNGHTVIDIDKFEVIDNTYWNDNDVPTIYIENGDEFQNEFLNWELGSRKCGSMVSIYDAIYKGYEVKSDHILVSLAYLSNGKFTDFNAIIFPDEGQTIEESVTEWQGDEEEYGLIKGEATLSFSDLFFIYEGDEYKLYSNHRTSVWVGATFRRELSTFFEIELPYYDGFIGYEYIDERRVDLDSTHYTYDFFTIADIKPERVDTFVADYGAYLVSAGYTYDRTGEAWDGGATNYTYKKDDIEITYLEPVPVDDYHYTEISVRCLSAISDIDD